MARKNAVRRRGNSDRDLKSFKHDYSKDFSDPNWPYNKGKLDRTGKMVLIVFPVIMVSAIVYVWYNASLQERVRTPLSAPKMISSNATSVAENPERFWGTYRSGLYFGMKTRTPQSPVAGNVVR